MDSELDASDITPHRDATVGRTGAGIETAAGTTYQPVAHHYGVSAVEVEANVVIPIGADHMYVIRPRSPRPHIHRKAAASGHHARLKVYSNVDVIAGAALSDKLVHDTLVTLLRAAYVGKHLDG
jgi:hypothetical protein